MKDFFNKKSKKITISFLAAFQISLIDSNLWIVETYKKIPPNNFSFSSDGLKIEVNASASPLIYKFQSPKDVKTFEVIGHLNQLPKHVQKQGSEGYDDFPLRIGFVLPGDKKLTAIERWIAADWIVRLFSLVPKEMGLDKIVFYNMIQNRTLLGNERIHPLSKYIHEKFSYLNSQAGDFKWNQTLDSPVTAVALWISIDGDDTNSKFQLQLKSLKLE